MRTIADLVGNRRKIFLSAAGLMSVAFAILLGPFGAVPTRAQAPAQNAGAAAPVFEYEVASIKPNKSVQDGPNLRDTSDGIRGTNFPMMMLIHYAFGIFQDYRYSGAPAWLNSEKYDLDAKMDASMADAYNKLPRDQQTIVFHHMVEKLLADRLKMETHRETKEMPVYFLVVGKNGPKLPEAKPDPNGPNNAHWGGPGMRDGIINVTAHNMTTEGLTNYLRGEMSRPVLDKTGLTGTYEFTLKYTPDTAAPPQPGGADAPFLLTAVQEQLGLKLESGKGPVEIIVIDHIERPSGN
jgi:uncharacterized protein (TIGR03435 family)